MTYDVRYQLVHSCGIETTMTLRGIDDEQPRLPVFPSCCIGCGDEMALPLAFAASHIPEEGE